MGGPPGLPARWSHPWHAKEAANMADSGDEPAAAKFALAANVERRFGQLSGKGT